MEVELLFVSFDGRSTIEVDRFDGEVDLEDLGIGKLREEGGAPRLDRKTPDLPADLTRSSSPELTDAPARLSLYPTVSTFALPYYEGVQSSSGDSDNDE